MPRNAPFTPPDFIDLQREQQSFDGIAAYAPRPAELAGTAAPVRIDVSKVSSNLFDVLGIRPMLGRPFTEQEDRPGVDVAVLSYDLWETRLGADRSIVGRTITLDRRPYTVVGVMPPGFSFPLRGPGFNARPAAAWVPMAFTAQQLQARGNERIHGVVGRLKTGTSIEEARAELEVLAERVNERYPLAARNRNFSIGFVAMPLREETSGPLQRPLLLLLGAVGLVLLVTCANVANLGTQQSGGAPSRACPPRGAWLQPHTPASTLARRRGDPVDRRRHDRHPPLSGARCGGTSGCRLDASHRTRHLR